MDAPAGRSRKKKERISVRRAAAAGGLICCMLLCLLFWRVIQTGTYREDPHAEPMKEIREAEIEKLQGQLQSQADESSFRVQLNGRPRVRGKQAELLLGNPSGNEWSLSVAIVLEETGETVYESGTLVPGAQVLTAELTKTLSPGAYPATAVCSAVDPSTGKEVGTPVRADLMVEVVETGRTDESPID